jgi:hypothetical protein
MGIKSRIQGSAPASDPVEKMFREERSFRAARLVEKWSRVPELGKGLKDLNEKSAMNTAILLENQARIMSRMTEAQMSSNFSGFTPENMLRLVRLAYPNSIRGKLFTEFACESAHDSIKYIRPVYTNSQTGSSMSNRTFGDFNTDGDSSFTGSDYRKAMYESTESRYATEMANGTVTQTNNTVGLTFTAGAFGTSGANYIDGYAALFLSDEKSPLAIQARTGEWFYGNVAVYNGSYYKVSSVTASNAYTWAFNLQVSADGVTYADYSGTSLDIVSYGRFNSEVDLTGEYLGEVELVMTDYQFKPRPLTLGVTWTQLTELILDTSFGVSAEEMLMDAAGQEIKKALDFNAVKFGYAQAMAHASSNVVTFNAEAGASTDDSYFHTAQLVSQAISRIGDIQLNDILRGGVTRIVGGPAAVTYLALNKGFTTKGAQSAIGGHQVGELNGIPIFKVPSSIIPDDELMTVWKNDANDSDVSIAFGTLLPFYSTGVLQRKNLYKEAAIARFEDVQALQPKYLGRIKISGIREIQ